MYRPDKCSLQKQFVKSQIVISRENNFFEGQGGGRRTLPYAFTEQGISILCDTPITNLPHNI